jgi:multicomponent Na+:H+ antiporter subunit F
VNAWIVSATILLLALVPVAISAFKGDTMDRLVALEMSGIITPIILLLLTQGFQRMALYDIALSAALLSFGGGLVFVRFLERWL